MGHYKANSTNSRNFTLSENNNKIGELQYPKWYTFNAEILLADNSKYTLEQKGFWNSKIELKKGDTVLLYFEMGWKGIVIHFHDSEKKYLLKLKGLLHSKYVLINTDEKELLAIETDFKWNKMTMDFNIETSNELDNFENKEVILFTAMHCVNYYMAYFSAVM